MYILNSSIPVTLAFVSLISNLFIAQPQIDLIDSNVQLEPFEQLITIHGQALVQTTDPYIPVVADNRLVVVTAYSSTHDQTDSTPFVTASGTYVSDGIVACNFLRFGDRVRFPELYGDKIFIVEDRMALKNSHKIDIWFDTREDAKQFGVKVLKVEVLEA